MRQQEPFSDTGTTWLFDYKHYAVIEKRIHPEGRCHLRGVETDDRRHAQHQARPRPLG